MLDHEKISSISPLLMMNAEPPLTKHATIAVAEGVQVLLETMIDLLMKRHLLTYDICQKIMKLTKSAMHKTLIYHQRQHS